MTQKLSENISVFHYTNSIIKKIDAKFFLLRSSFKSLKVYEIFAQIIINRGYKFVEDFEIKNHNQIKRSIMKQLDASMREIDTNDYDKCLKEAFYLGMLCNTIIHTDIPLPTEFKAFGKIAVSPKDIDKNPW
jgi:hypothetical protein